MREREVEGELAVTKCDTADNLADMFTKVLDSVPFAKLHKLVMNTVLRAATRTSFHARAASALGRLRSESPPAGGCK